MTGMQRYCRGMEVILSTVYVNAFFHTSFPTKQYRRPRISVCDNADRNWAFAMSKASLWRPVKDDTILQL